MEEQRFPQEIDPEVIRLARFKSQQLASKYGFANYDAEDIQQELVLDYLQRSRFYDRHLCSRRTFARLVINNSVATMIEARVASCRDYRVRRVSLDEWFDPTELNSPKLLEILVDPSSNELEARLNLTLDIELLLARLPADLVSLCRSIMVCNTCAEAAAKVGLSRATFYRQIRRVRNEFAPGIGAA